MTLNRLPFIFLAAGLALLFSSLKTSAQDIHHRNEDLPCVNKNFNIIAHVAVDTSNTPLYTAAEIDSILVKVSEYFSPICMSFSSCDYHVLENDYSLGWLRDEPILKSDQIDELKSRFSLRRRINLFFVDYITTEHCGESTFQGIYTLLDANAFIEVDCWDGPAEQVSHHIGHLMGLSNTYSFSDIELVDGSNCQTAGDRLCDTPADPYSQEYISAEDAQLLADEEITDSYFNFRCEFIYEIKDPNGDYYQPDMGNMMSAYPCKCGFSREQYLLMVENYLKSTIKFF